MAKTKIPLFSFRTSGTLGKSVTFHRRHRKSYVRQKPAPEDPRSLLQLSWRHMYQKAVALWHALSPAEKQNWESQARRKHMTGYAWFLSQALKPNPGLYLPLQGGAMTGNIDMNSNRILALPQPTVNQEASTKKYTDDTVLTRSLFVWKDVSTLIMSDSDRTVDLAWTDLDLSVATSNKAKLAILNLRIKTDIIGTGKQSSLAVRKNGTTQAFSPTLAVDKLGVSTGVYSEAIVIVGLDISQELEYEIDVGVDWQIDSRIVVLGYIE